MLLKTWQHCTTSGLAAIFEECAVASLEIDLMKNFIVYSDDI